MVDWYDPGQLMNTAVKTIVSTMIGANADPRLGTADPRPGRYFDYSRELTASGRDFEPIDDSKRTEMWIDYAADVGDGWNSTYSVAASLAKRELKVEVNGDVRTVQRGEILILGGDGVYPTASPTEYKNRLVLPYNMAFRANERPLLIEESETIDLHEHPHIFALPGNHDWYDSLVAFRALFCSHIFNHRKFADGWRTRQKRSYFALKLPSDWWFLGVDLQLSHNIDVSQLQYFESIVDRMNVGDKVILGVPEPYWVKAIKYEGMTPVFAQKEASIEKLENFFERRGIHIKLYVAGDLHHYRRFENASGVQKITAGGGGAFLHPTHDFDYRKADKKKPREFKLVEEYPTSAVSRKQDVKNLWFGLSNKWFGVVTAVIYPILAWLIHGKIPGGGFTVKQALSETAMRIIDTPLATLLIVLMLFALIAFTDSNSRWYKWAAGFLHGCAHLAAIFMLAWFAYWVSDLIVARFDLQNRLTYANAIWFACVLIIPAIGGYFIGAAIMGFYLFVSLHWWGRHDNEAFSALKIEDFKNFLRFHIDSNGDLTIYPFKIDTVPKEWTPVEDAGVIVGYKPETEITPELIEKPISI